MENNFTKKKGFTLIEIVICLSVIGIVSVGIYGMYTSMIKHTKSAEEKQSISLAGKRAIEDMKIIPSGSINLTGEGIKIKDLPFVKDDLAMDVITMEGSGDSFEKKLYLDRFYKYCPDDSTDAVYEGIISITKAKGKNAGDIQDIDIDLNASESGEETGENINNISYNFNMNKESGEGKSSKINEETISSDGGNLELKVYIEENGGNNVRITIKDKSGNKLIEETNSLDSDPIKENILNLHFNYRNYMGDKENNEILKDMKINVYNKISSETNFNARIYIEKSVDLDLNVEAKAKQGEITIYNREDNVSMEKIGPLYYINVKIYSKKDGTELFSGWTARNINIE